MISVLALLGLTAAAQMNLFCNGGFEPVRMRGEATAARGWMIVDEKRMVRNFYNRPSEDGKEYISGYQCFRLSFSPGVMTIRFLENAPADYYRYNVDFHFYNHTSRMPELAAPQYRIRGGYKLNKGTLKLLAQKPFPASGQWREIDVTVSAKEYNSRRLLLLLNFKPLPGMELSLRNFSLEAVYPPSKANFIRLPNGGKLESLTLPEKASFELRYLAAVWQSWLWRVTGVVLPVKEGGSAKNSFVFRKGEVPKGGWKIKVDKNGGELVYGKESTLSPALYEYLRHLGVIIFAPDCRQIPDQDSALVLAAVNKTVAPRFYQMKNNLANGAYDWNLANSSVDWYTWDHTIFDHNMNTLLPVEIYRKDHPEYYMMMEDGTRQKVRNQFIMSPCLSNEEAKNIIEKNSGDMLRASPFADAVEFVLGDRPVFCYCPECRKNNDNYSDIMLEMTNRLARQAQKIRPGFEVYYTAYLQLRKLPKKVRPEKNVIVDFCLPPYNWPCLVHVTCKENEKPFEELVAWSKLAGPDQVGLVTYNEERPWHYLKQMELLNKYAKAFHQTHSSEKQIHYIVGRWNLGADGEEAIKEFNDGYFGKGGKYMTQIQRMVEDFCEKYQHRPGEVSSAFYSITVMSWVFNRKTVLTREVFDRIYPLFDQAFAAVGKDRTLRTRLLLEKFRYLNMDLAKYRYTDCGSDAETKAFAKRLQDFIGLCSELNSLNLPYPTRLVKTTIMNNMPARQFIQLVAGLKLPTTTGDWTKEPVLKKFLEDPEKHLILKPQAIPGGVLFLPGLMRGGFGPEQYSHQCPKKLGKFIRRSSSGTGTISVVLKLDKKPESPLLLVAEGLDDDKPGTSTMEIAVNGKVIFSGANTFEEHNWTRMSFTIPAETLQAGENRIQFRNTVPDRKEKKPSNEDNGIYLGQGAPQDYTWGWIGFSRIHVLDMSGEFRKFLAGGSSAWQKFPRLNKPEGVIELRNGALYMKSKGAPYTAVYFPTPQKDDRISLKAGETIRCTLEGSGVVGFGFWSYDQAGKYINSGEKTGVINTVKPGKGSFTLTVPEKSTVNSIVPFIRGSRKGGTVTNVYYEIIRPQK